MQKYYLGVDGGNTKTDYLLCTVEGKFIDLLHTGTCSHECFDDGYNGMEKAMRSQLNELFSRNGINVEDIAAAGFGLAGADLPHQVVELKKRVEAIGFTCYGLANDGILGIKGASESGVGLCAVNGTGTVVVGINQGGDILQVGGVGHLTGDFAGGGYIRDQIITALYAFHYRCDAGSAMFAPLLQLLGATQENLIETVCDWDLLYRNTKEIIKIGAQAAVEGDAVAEKIFDSVGVSIAKSAAGAIKRLSFDGFGTAKNPIDIVQVGSIWHKIPYQGMSEIFLKTVQELSGKTCRIVKLEATAALGGVFWAKEIADGIAPSAEYRRLICLPTQ